MTFRTDLNGLRSARPIGSTTVTFHDMHTSIVATVETSFHTPGQIVPVVRIGSDENPEAGIALASGISYIRKLMMPMPSPSMTIIKQPKFTKHSFVTYDSLASEFVGEHKVDPTVGDFITDLVRFPGVIKGLHRGR